MVGTGQHILNNQEDVSRRQRSHILKNVLDGKTFEEAYVLYRNEIGMEWMDYGEFNFWYYRFYNGNHDLDLNRNFERQSMEFSDLPINIIELFAEKLEPFHRLIFRKVSPDVADAVDKFPVTCKELYLENSEENAAVIMDGRTLIKCLPSLNGCHAEYNRKREEIEGGNALKVTLNELLLILRSPQLKLEIFTVQFGPCMDTEKEREQFKKCIAHVDSQLNKMEHKISVEEIRFYIDGPDMALAILPYLKPGILKTIRFTYKTGEGHQAIFDQLVKLDQWKQAETTIGSMGDEDVKVPIEQAFLFTRYVGCFKEISRADLITIRDILLKTTNTHHCRWRLKQTPEEYKKFANEVDFVFESSIRATGPSREDYLYFELRHFSFIHHVDDTDRAFKIEVKRENFIITRL